MEAERTSREDRKADEKLQQQNGPVGISNGRQLANFAIDQLRVITLLGQIPPIRGGTLGSPGPQSVSLRIGLCRSDLHQAILNFQRANSSLGVVDGWISPTGRTLRLMKSLAESRGGGVAQGSGPAHTIEELIRQTEIVISAGRSLLQPDNIGLIPSNARGRLGSLITQLESDASQLRQGRPRGNLPVQNNAIAIGGILIIIAAAAVIIGISADPVFQKNASITLAGVVRGLEVRAGQISRLSDEILIAAFANVAAGVAAVASAASKLKANFKSCDPKFLALSEAAFNFTSAARSPRNNAALLNALMKAFADALSALLTCLRANGATAEQIATILNVLLVSVKFLDIPLKDAIEKLFLKGIALIL